jgi:hypothetical protein
MKTTLSVSISLIALTAGSAVAAQHSALVAPRTAIHHVNLPPGMLYNQNSNFGVEVNSQNFTILVRRTVDTI